MTSARPDASSTAAELRRAFDEGFASAALHRVAEPEPFLLLRIGKNAHAVRIREIRGFAAARKIVPLASAIPELLGIAGFRGSLVPVYDLGALLGYSDRDAAPRWFILCGEVDSVALAFTEFDGYAERPREDTGEGKGGAHTAAQEVLRLDGLARAVIDISAIVDAVKNRVGMGPAPEPTKRPKEP